MAALQANGYQLWMGLLVSCLVTSCKSDSWQSSFINLAETSPPPSARPASLATLTAQKPAALKPEKLTFSDRNFPEDAKLINVKTKYGAKGDGKTDDTLAIQKALSDTRDWNKMDYYGKPRAVYFPAGTYLVSDALKWPGCCLTVQGQGAERSIIKLKDQAPGYNDPEKPKYVLRSASGNVSFRQNIRDIGVNTGSKNPGAIGISYIANNTGVLTDVSIRSGDGQGVSGLDMTRKWPGPCLIKNLQVQGFDYGIHVSHTEYGPTFENLSLIQQNKAGIRNEGNTIAVRRLKSANRAPAIENASELGMVVLLDSKLQGSNPAISAIINKGYLYARNVTTSGYKSAVNHQDKVVAGNTLTEYVSGKVQSLFPGSNKGLNLPIQNTPDFQDNNLANWARFSPNHYGDTKTLQATLNSGKATVYFPHGGYLDSRRTIVTVPASVRRIVGMTSVVNEKGIVFRVEAPSSQPLIIEQFGYGIHIEHNSKRPLVIKHGKYNYQAQPGAGPLFLEDVEIKAPFKMQKGQSVWARQLNIETLIKPGLKMRNDGAKLWILGLKTEGRGTIIHTLNNGMTELLGTLVYPVEKFRDVDLLEPAFLSEDSSQSLIYSVSVHGAGKNYAIQVQETRKGKTQQFPSKGLSKGRMPLFVGSTK
jgi:Pectate lyase superfamily protein